MEVGEFWNQAFLAALTRLPADNARQEANAATALCIRQWQPDTYRWHQKFIKLWATADICEMPRTLEGKPFPES